MIILCTSCTRPTSYQDKIANITSILIDPEKINGKINLSTILSDSVEIIPLETTEECLIGEIKRLEFTPSAIYISDKPTNKIFEFDLSGKYKKTIGKIGPGPGEYSRLGDFAIVGDSIIVSDNYTGKYIIYNVNNNEYRSSL